MSDPVLLLNDVSKTYAQGRDDGLTVLQSVNLQLEPGEVVALVAPSGAGKSTLLHIAGLLDAPSGGGIRICGVDATRLRDRARTELRRDKVGFVYQFHHLLPEFSARENVAMPMRAAAANKAEASARADNLLGLVGLSHRADHRPAELSGGEQQRVAVCRALANSPKLLLADEPTGNLDPETATQVFDMFLSLARDTGLTALVATHNLDLAARMDRTVRLKEGRLA